MRKRHNIGHSLEREWPSRHTFTRERPNFFHETRYGHNFAGDRWKHGHKSASILQAFVHRLSANTKTGITLNCLKKIKTKIKQFFFLIRAGRCVNRAGRKPVRTGRSALGNMPSPEHCACVVYVSNIKFIDARQTYISHCASKKHRRSRWLQAAQIGKNYRREFV